MSECQTAPCRSVTFRGLEVTLLLVAPHMHAHTHALSARGVHFALATGRRRRQDAQSLVRAQRARRGCCCSSGFRLGGRQSVPRPCGPVVSRGLPRAGTTQCSPGPGLPRHTQWDRVPGAHGAPAPSTPRGLQCPGSIGASLGLSVGGDAGRAVRPAPGLAGPVRSRRFSWWTPPYLLWGYLSLFRWVRCHKIILLSIIITTFDAIIISPLTRNYYYYCYYNDC